MVDHRSATRDGPQVLHQRRGEEARVRNPPHTNSQIMFLFASPLRPHTGRRHQLRLHMVHIGHPILGDATYAGDDGTTPRMCLHAHSLRLSLGPPGASATAASAEAGGGAAGTVGSTKLRPPEVDECGNNSSSGPLHRDPPKVIPLEFVAPDPFVFADGELNLG